jgi:aspartate carbamoyltransferase regulatory subunit
MKELNISAISDGTVIDHIPAEHTFKVVAILNLPSFRQVVSIASNLDSGKMGKKGIIKVGGLSLRERDVQKIALLAPDATLNIIKDFKVIKKRKLSIPPELDHIVKCFNPHCITNREPVPTRFTVETKEPLTLRCRHCERVMKREEMELI